MDHPSPTFPTLEQLRDRLRRIDDALRTNREHQRQLRRDAAILHAERRGVAAELARATEQARTDGLAARERLKQHVIARMAYGMTARQIAQMLSESPAVVSRIIEEVKAAERKRKTRED